MEGLWNFGLETATECEDGSAQWDVLWRLEGKNFDRVQATEAGCEASEESLKIFQNVDILNQHSVIWISLG